MSWNISPTFWQSQHYTWSWKDLGCIYIYIDSCLWKSPYCFTEITGSPHKCQHSQSVVLSTSPSWCNMRPPSAGSKLLKRSGGCVLVSCLLEALFRSTVGANIVVIMFRLISMHSVATFLGLLYPGFAPRIARTTASNCKAFYWQLWHRKVSIEPIWKRIGKIACGHCLWGPFDSGSHG